jgi:ParB family chromosome partitioning protein
MEAEKCIAAAAEHPGAFFAEISLDRLAPNDYNARRFQENMTPQRQARFEELVASVRKKGILEPLLVRSLDGERFEVIAGERRYRAALLAAEAWETAADYLVPCMVRNVGDDEAFDLMVIENLHREDLTPFETARAFQDYLKRHGNTPEAVSDLAGRTGLPAHAIRRQVRLLDLPPEVLTSWRDGALSQSHVELFTRLADHAQALELLTLCLRLKLSTRELAERISAISPDIDKGFFDKAECLACGFNTSVQCGLFSDSAPGGKCGNATCFEDKQAAFLSENWLHSKAAEKFGTRGFRFGHRLAQEHREPITAPETAGRCLECDQFVSVLRLTGAVVSGYDRTCVGPRTCFEELYRNTPPSPAASPEPKTAPEPAPEQKGHAKQDPAPATSKSAKPAASPATKKTTPPTESGPVFSAPRGEKFREAFLKEAIPERIKGLTPTGPHSTRLWLLVLAIASPAVRSNLIAGLGLDRYIHVEDLAEKIFEVPLEQLGPELQGAVISHLISSPVPADVRAIVARQLEISLSRDWILGKDYLESLSKGEIVRVGEEPGVDIWSDDKLKAYKKDKYKGKALLSLKKEELIDLILNSGVELKGRVPAEVLGKAG